MSNNTKTDNDCVREKVFRSEHLRKQIKSNEEMETISHILTDTNACYRYIMQHYPLDFEAKMSLVVVQAPRSDVLKINKWVSRFLSKVDDDFWGMAHLTLTFGSCQVDWRQDSLAIPKRVKSKASVFCAELEGVTVTKQDIRKIAEYIVTWNRDMVYAAAPKNIRTQNKNKGNCHEFVFNLLRSLNVDVRNCLSNDVIKKKLFNLHDVNSQSSFHRIKLYKFQNAPQLSKVLSEIDDKNLKCKKDVFVFDGHKQLDDFFIKLCSSEHYLQNPEEYKDIIEYGRCFDRALWMRIGCREERVKIPGAASTLHSKCIFGDPYADEGLFSYNKKIDS
ncbi:tyrosine-protein kinase [Acrasis kona]|uniref:Tyrosine-protein kinase n=1 Tax=Acrasis kona TaxID=1008807 RepID=A0AAW2Z010_9EUKA